MEYTESNGFVVNEQNGFRADRSCLDHIFVLHNVLRIRKQLKEHNFCAFVDFKKAFDFVDRDFLLHKLTQIGINGKNFYSIKALYNDAISSLQLNDMASE